MLRDVLRREGPKRLRHADIGTVQSYPHTLIPHLDLALLHNEYRNVCRVNDAAADTA